MSTPVKTSPRQIISSLHAQLAQCMLIDRFQLRRRLQQATAALESNALKANALKDSVLKDSSLKDNALADIAGRIRASSARMQSRKSLLPIPEYPLELPVSSRKDEIAEAISKHQVVIVCGETGSGKTTQLPKICLELGRGVSGLIGHTQPRRIAARSVASRIAQELKSPLGQVVGYKVRFNDKLSETSYIKLMTDGILLAETQGDRYLNAYDTIIIDEAHERSLNIDFLLGYLKQLLPKRPDLKVIVTSATIDADRFSRHFNGAPVIEVSGRTYPVEVRYRPLGKAGYTSQSSDEADDISDDEATLYGIKRKGKTEARWLEEDDAEEAIEEAIMDAADDLLRQGDGDILVFLPGEREIRDTAEHLRKYQGRSAKLKHIEVLPLFARLSIEDQQKIFRSSGNRRIVLATNVAETSLTVPGIKYVIDAGLARVNRYSARAKVEQLHIEKISQAAARQRAGRCGRVSNGICVRLYSEEDFNGRPEYTDPEILRSSLASVILRMAALKLSDVNDFPFIEAPSSRLITDGYLLLQELGAVDEQRRLTDIGAQLAKLPLDPKIGRMILAAKKENCVNEILIIASALAMQDPRERPMDKREAADQAHAKFADERSDFMGFLKLWDFYDEALRHKKSNRALLNKCHSNFLSFLRLKEWRELHGQIASIVGEMGFITHAKQGLVQAQPSMTDASSKTSPATSSPALAETSYEQIHRALLAGLLGNIGFKDGEADSYQGARGIRFSIAPGSALKKTRPKWVMAGELMETTKLYGRCVAKIDPDWIEPIANQGGPRGLTQSHYSDPRWDRKAAQVVAWERVSLYGLTIIPKRRVHYGPVNPQEARELFIREALANREFDTHAPFFAANQKLIAEIEELEHKARRQDVLVDEHALFAFYDAIIPAGIVNGAGFEKWRSTAEKTQPRLLYLTRDALMRHGATAVTESQFPETFVMDGVTLELKYRFEPGHMLDGVTATIPLALLNQLDPTASEWLVPGMIREKVATLIKALPKTYRRVCVPVPEFVTAFLQQLGSDNTDRASNPNLQPLLTSLANFIHQQTTLRIEPADWPADALPAHLLMNFRVVDEKGRELGMGRNWNALKQQFGQAAQLTFRSASPDIEKSGIRQWDFGDLPATLTFSRDGRQLTGYPSLEDAGDSVSVKLFDTEAAALSAHRAGVCRLMRFELKEQMKQLEKGLPGFNQYALLLRNIISTDDLREDMLATIADRAFIGEDELPRTNQAFMTLKQRARTRLPAVTEALARIAQAIASEYQQLVAKQNQMPATVNRLKRDVGEQLNSVLHKHCFSQTPWEYLQHIPRYLKALRLRIEKHPANPDRDGRNAQAVGVLWQNWQEAVEKQRKADKLSQDLLNFRWLIEELRVSLFAQELKTPFPVSIKRLEKIWGDIAK